MNELLQVVVWGDASQEKYILELVEILEEMDSWRQVFRMRFAGEREQ